MSYGYPPQGGQGGYPPQQGGYPGGGQPGYPPQGQPGGYGAPGAPGGYPPAQAGGYGQAPGGYPPAPGGAGGYGGAPSSIGFEGVGAQQPPAQNYGAPPAGYGAPQAGYGAPPQPTGGYPPQQGGYGAPPQAGGYPAGGSAPPQPGYAPQQQPYGAPPPGQQGYGQAPGYGASASAPMPTNQQMYGQQNVQPAYSQPAHSSPHAGAKVSHMTQGMAAMAIKTHGTVKPFSGFNAESDAQVLRKAMKGLGTDEKAIINVLGYRSCDQRQKIKTQYKQAYGRDLVKDIKSEVSGNFEELLCAMLMKPREYDAYCLYDAMAGAGTTESTLIEILVSRSNAEKKEINDIYQKKYHKKLENELMSETSGHFRKLLVSLNNAGRDESHNVNVAKAREDADKLYRAGEKKWGTDEATFNLIMASRSHVQLQATFDEYYKVAKRDIIKSIQSEFSGDVEDGMCAIVDIARNPPSYFAKRLYQSMKGAGTNDTMLIRVMVSRSEVDMVEIKHAFKNLFKKELGKFIGDDTSGDYKKLLHALVGN
uniref:Annexin n=1 Tax=Phallusia mammillata TaxID=59560 RepID=A0A6F9D714_9ASCI|nr:annexin-B12-like [Phallusia mammillata]